MFNLLLSDEAASANTGSKYSWIIYVVLILLVVAMLVIPSITNRRRMKEYNQMVDRLRVGDEVRTIGGIIGRVTKIDRKGPVTTFTMETGAKGSKTTMEFDINAVGTVLTSTYVEPQADAKTNAQANKEAAKDAKAEPAKEEAPAEQPKEAETPAAAEAEKQPADKKPAAKKTARKPAAKKTTQK